MGTFIADGASVLPPIKSDARPASGAVTEWAAGDANKERSALLDLRTQAIITSSALATEAALRLAADTAETAARQAADAAIIAAGTVVALSGGSYATATGTPTARTLNDRFADHVNAADYGLEPNNASAATANVIALQAAFTAALARGTRVYVPGYNYWFNGKVSIPPSDSDTGLVGPGAHFLWNGANTAGTVFLEISGGPTTLIEGITFTNMINGSSGIPTSDLGAVAVTMNQTYYYKSVIKFHKCRFNYWNIGVVSYREVFSAGGQNEQCAFDSVYWVQCHTGVCSGIWPGTPYSGSNQGDYWGFWHCHWANCVIGWNMSGGAQNYSSLHNCVMTSQGSDPYSCWVFGNSPTQWSTYGILNFYDCQSEVTRFNFDLLGRMEVNWYGGILGGFRMNGFILNLFGAHIGAPFWTANAINYALGDGTTQDFTFTCYIHDVAHPALMVFPIDNGPPLATSEYVVTANADQTTSPGGTVHFNTAPANNSPIAFLECAYALGGWMVSGYINDYGAMYIGASSVTYGMRGWDTYCNPWLLPTRAGVKGIDAVNLSSFPGGGGVADMSKGAEVRGYPGLKVYGTGNLDPSFDKVFKVFDPSGVETFAVDRYGRPTLTDNGNLPLPTAALAGKLWWDARQGVAVRDELYFCCQDVGGAWVWRALF